MGPAEEALAAAGIELEVDPGPFIEVDGGLTACIAMRPQGEGFASWRLVVRPGLTDEQRETVAQWSSGLIARWSTGEMESDGWQATSWGGYQLWAREHELPSWE